MVVCLGGVPFSKAVDVNVPGVTEAFAGGDHWIFGSVFFVKAHVASGYISVSLFGRSFLRRIV